MTTKYTRKQLRAWNRLSPGQRDFLRNARRREIADRSPCPSCGSEMYRSAGEYRCRAQCWRETPEAVVEGLVWAVIGLFAAFTGMCDDCQQIINPLRQPHPELLREELADSNGDGWVQIWRCDPPAMGVDYEVVRDEWNADYTERTIHEVNLA